MKNMLLLFVLFCSMTMLFGQTPSTLSLQGVLREVTGAAAADGDYSMTFKMYDVETGGTALWTETQTARVNNGVYSVQLGAVTALGLPFDKQYYVGVTVGGTELAPRMVLTAAPYTMSLRGSSNVFAGGGNVGIGTTTPTNKLDVVGGIKSTGYLATDGWATVGGNLVVGTAASPMTLSVNGNLAISGYQTRNEVKGISKVWSTDNWYGGGIHFPSSAPNASTKDFYWISRAADNTDNRLHKMVFMVPNATDQPGSGYYFAENGQKLMTIDNGTGDVTAKGQIKSRDQFVPISGGHRTVILSGVVQWSNATGTWVPSFKWKTHDGMGISGSTDSYWTFITLPAGYTLNYLAGISLTGVQFGSSGEPKMHLFSRVPDENGNAIHVHQSWFNNNDQHAGSYSIVIVLNVPN